MKSHNLFESAIAELESLTVRMKNIAAAQALSEDDTIDGLSVMSMADLICDMAREEVYNYLPVAWCYDYDGRVIRLGDTVEMHDRILGKRKIAVSDAMGISFSLPDTKDKLEIHFAAKKLAQQIWDTLQAHATFHYAMTNIGRYYFVCAVSKEKYIENRLVKSTVLFTIREAK